MELKACPFCGGEAKLKRINSGYKLNPTTIIDMWAVVCKSGCCRGKSVEDKIYQKENGEIVVEINGAEEAIKEWNRRAN